MRSLAAYLRYTVKKKQKHLRTTLLAQLLTTFLKSQMAFYLPYYILIVGNSYSPLQEYLIKHHLTHIAPLSLLHLRCLPYTLGYSDKLKGKDKIENIFWVICQVIFNNVLWWLGVTHRNEVTFKYIPSSHNSYQHHQKSILYFYEYMFLNRKFEPCSSRNQEKIDKEELS